MRTLTVPPSVHSTGTTLSAPRGIGAPVMIRTQVPGVTTIGWLRPARNSPTTGRAIGFSSEAPARSPAWTAYPSMAELSNPGRLTPETMSSHSTKPTESISGWSNAGRAVTRPSTASRCSSTLRLTSLTLIHTLRVVAPGHPDVGLAFLVGSAIGPAYLDEAVGFVERLGAGVGLERPERQTARAEVLGEVHERRSDALAGRFRYDVQLVEVVAVEGEHRHDPAVVERHPGLRIRQQHVGEPGRHLRGRVDRRRQLRAVGVPRAPPHGGCLVRVGRLQRPDQQVVHYSPAAFSR